MIVVYAKTNPEAGAHGITAFIVEKVRVQQPIAHELFMRLSVMFIAYESFIRISFFFLNSL